MNSSIVLCLLVMCFFMNLLNACFHYFIFFSARVFRYFLIIKIVSTFVTPPEILRNLRSLIERNVFQCMEIKSERFQYCLNWW